MRAPRVDVQRVSPQTAARHTRNEAPTGQTLRAKEGELRTISEPTVTRIQPHQVAALLSDEQKARVSAATFTKQFSCINQLGDTRLRCPLAVALDLPTSDLTQIENELATDDKESYEIIADFMRWADSGFSNPDDVYALLGCEPASRSDDQGGAS